MAGSGFSARSAGLGPTFRILSHALRHPRHYARLAKRLRSLVEAFAAGGVVVDTGAIQSIAQADGDLQVCLGPDLRKCDEQDQARALAAHFATLEQRLRPLDQAGEIVTALRGGLVGLGTLSSGGTEVARLLADPTAYAVWWLLPHIITLAALFIACFARRLVWWSIRRRITGLAGPGP